VFGHEVGHVRHNHMLFYFLFVLASVFALSFVAESLQSVLVRVSNVTPALARSQLLEHLPIPLLLIGLYFGVVFGFVSRRFERQADLFGCLAVSCPQDDGAGNRPVGPGPRICPSGVQTFAGALEKIACLNGTTRNTRSWRHASIAKRAAFLRAVVNNPKAQKAFQTSIARVKVGVVALAIGAVVYVAHCQWLFH